MAEKSNPRAHCDLDDWMELEGKNPVSILNELYPGIQYRKFILWFVVELSTDYGRPERKKPSLHGRKFNPNPKFLGMANVYFVCHFCMLKNYTNYSCIKLRTDMAEF